MKKINEKLLKKSFREESQDYTRLGLDDEQQQLGEEIKKKNND